MPLPDLRVGASVVTDDIRRLHRHLLAAGAVIVVVLAIALLLGWDALTRGRADWPQIYPYSVAGAAALLAAMALMDLGAHRRSRAATVTGWVLAGLTALLGVGTDLAVSAGVLPSVDPATGGSWWVAILPSFAATAAAASVFLIPWSHPVLAQVRFWLAAAAGLVTMQVLLSYVYGSDKLISGLGFTGTSLPMALIGLVIVGASMSARPDLPPLRGLDAHYDRGLLRRVLPLLAIAPFVPAVVHALVAAVEPDPASADAISQLVTVVILITVIVVMGGGQSRARREVTTQRQRVWHAFAHAPSGTAVVSIDGRIVTANDALIHLTGRSSLEGQSLVDLVTPPEQGPLAEALAQMAAGRRGLRRDMRMDTGTGATTWVDLSLAPVRDVSGRVVYLILQCVDLTDRKHLERVLAERAIRDPLTGLLNRDGLEQQIGVLRRQAVDGRDVVIVFADVDGLKEINDRHGHGAGDEVLREVARRLLDGTRSEDVVARIGGDEFVVVTTVPASQPDAGQVVIDRLRARLTGSVQVGHRDVVLSVSLGASTLTSFGDPTTAMADADRAMYVDKGRRRRASDR